jgi:hypothetical protein
MNKRKYFPTFAELVDRLAIVQLKAIFIPQCRENYLEEIKLIEHDIDLLFTGDGEELPISINASSAVRAILVIMLTNRYIWENESKAREGGDDQNNLLKLTHSINGVRNTAKNILSQSLGDRVDLKVDCLAAGLPREFGDWRIWEK